MDFDYSSPGAYFVTICTLDKKCWFGKVSNSEMILNSYGKIVEKIWGELKSHFLTVDLDEKGLINQTPTQNPNHWIQMKNPKINLGKIIRHFKAKTTKLLRDSGLNNISWQRLYYDHIIRNNRSLDNIRYYIINNPLKWEIDKENSKNWK
jgi:hypothetical protein